MSTFPFRHSPFFSHKTETKKEKEITQQGNIYISEPTHFRHVSTVTPLDAQRFLHFSEKAMAGPLRDSYLVANSRVHNSPTPPPPPRSVTPHPPTIPLPSLPFASDFDEVEEDCYFSDDESIYTYIEDPRPPPSIAPRHQRNLPERSLIPDRPDIPSKPAHLQNEDHPPRAPPKPHRSLKDSRANITVANNNFSNNFVPIVPGKLYPIIGGIGEGTSRGTVAQEATMKITVSQAVTVPQPKPTVAPSSFDHTNPPPPPPRNRSRQQNVKMVSNEKFFEVVRIRKEEEVKKIEIAEVLRPRMLEVIRESAEMRYTEKREEMREEKERRYAEKREETREDKERRERLSHFGATPSMQQKFGGITQELEEKLRRRREMHGE